VDTARFSSLRRPSAHSRSLASSRVLADPRLARVPLASSRVLAPGLARARVDTAWARVDTAWAQMADLPRSPPKLFHVKRALRERYIESTLHTRPVHLGFDEEAHDRTLARFTWALNRTVALVLRRTDRARDAAPRRAWWAGRRVDTAHPPFTWTGIIASPSRFGPGRQGHQRRPRGKGSAPRRLDRRNTGPSAVRCEKRRAVGPTAEVRWATRRTTGKFVDCSPEFEPGARAVSRLSQPIQLGKGQKGLDQYIVRRGG
jgi:hypothetical protein